MHLWLSWSTTFVIMIANYIQAFQWYLQKTFTFILLPDRFDWNAIEIQIKIPFNRSIDCYSSPQKKLYVEGYRRPNWSIDWTETVQKRSIITPFMVEKCEVVMTLNSSISLSRGSQTNGIGSFWIFGPLDTFWSFVILIGSKIFFMNLALLQIK